MAAILAIREMSETRVSGEFGPIRFYLDREELYLPEPGELAMWSGYAEHMGDRVPLDVDGVSTPTSYRQAEAADVVREILKPIVEFAMDQILKGNLTVVSQSEFAAIRKGANPLSWMDEQVEVSA